LRDVVTEEYRIRINRRRGITGRYEMAEKVFGR